MWLVEGSVFVVFFIKIYNLYLPSAVFIAQVLVEPSKQPKQIIQIEHNIVTNPGWSEVNQLAIYTEAWPRISTRGYWETNPARSHSGSVLVVKTRKTAGWLGIARRGMARPRENSNIYVGKVVRYRLNWFSLLPFLSSPFWFVCLLVHRSRF